MVFYEKEIVKYLGLPSIPKKEHDGKTPFDKGVALLKLVDGSEAYASYSFNTEKGDKEPRIKKVFGLIPYSEIKAVYVVPNYMAKEEDVDKMDLDVESKKKAKEILKEAKELENEGTEVENPMENLPEWIFSEISTKEEAQAWLNNYNKQHNIKRGNVPTDDDTLKLRLFAIYSELNKKK